MLWGVEVVVCWVNRSFTCAGSSPPFFLPASSQFMALLSIFQTDSHTFLPHGSKKLSHGQPDVHDAA